MAGDRKLPPPLLKEVRRGFRLFCASLRFWLPAIAFVILIYAVLAGRPRGFADHALATLLLASPPILLALYCGSLVGIARYAAFGERSLIYRRLENVRLRYQIS